MERAVIVGGILLVVLIAAATAFYTDTGSDATEMSQVTDQSCDVQNRCDEGYRCIQFPETDGPRCAEEGVLKHYRCPIGTQMLIQERYPPNVICSPQGVLGLLR